MKQKLIQIYQLLNQIAVVGQQNVFALGNAMALVSQTIKEIEALEEQKQVIISNTKEV